MFVNWYLLSGATNSLLRRPISLSLQAYFNRFLLLLFLCLCAYVCVYVFMSVCLFVFVHLCVYDCVCGYIRVCVRLRGHLPMSIFYYCVFLPPTFITWDVPDRFSFNHSLKIFSPTTNQSCQHPNWKIRWNWIKVNLQKTKYKSS